MAKRILFVSGLTARGVGGAQTETARLLAGLSDRGIEGAIAIDRQPGIAGITHFPLDYPPSKQAATQVRNAVNVFRPDLVHVVGGGVGFLRRIDAAVSPVPWVFTAHNVPPCERTFPTLYGHNVLHYVARNLKALPSVMVWKHFLANGGFRKVICHSATVSARLEAVGCPAAKINQIPFGLDLPDLPTDGTSPFPSGAYPKILTVAGYIHHKGLHDAVRIMARLKQRFENAAYRIIGERRDKKYASFLERQIELAGVGDFVSLTPSASDATKAAALREADLYLQPSHEEGFCLAFAEAAAIVPRLVGTATGEMPGFATGDESAAIVPAKRPTDLLEATTRLLNLSLENDVVRRRQERLARRYSWQSYYDKHLATYD